jgi:hypothetical protein
VSLKSFPLVPLDEDAVTADVVDALAGASIIGWPSRKAFSLAALSARAFLSASIWAFTAALALASSSFSTARR